MYCNLWVISHETSITPVVQSIKEAIKERHHAVFWVVDDAGHDDLNVLSVPNDARIRSVHVCDVRQCIAYLRLYFFAPGAQFKLDYYVHILWNYTGVRKAVCFAVGTGYLCHVGSRMRFKNLLVIVNPDVTSKSLRLRHCTSRD